MKAGSSVGERYVVRERIGSGAMGEVFRAHDLRTGGEVAIKVIRIDAESGDGKARFLKEARALAAVVDDSVVRYLDHGVTEDDLAFLAMEWIEGETLAHRLRRGPLSFEACRTLGVALAKGLAACHASGVVHRDLKPSNIMLRGGAIEAPVIVDFGLARVSAERSMTASGTRLGTPRFMAPEQVRDPRRVDGRADVFSLGCVLFEALSGCRAFSGDDAMGVMVRILLDRAPRVTSVCGGVPSSLAAAIDAMLEPSVASRPPADACARALVVADVSPRGAEPAVFVTEDAAAPPGGDGASLDGLADDLPTVSLLPAASLPIPRNAFVGRRSELERIAAALGEERTVVVVWGPPGIGKTRVALEAIARVRGASPLLCDARGHGGVSDLTAELARAASIDVGGTSGDEAMALVARGLRRLPRSLVLVDGLSQIDRDLARWVRGLLVAAPHARIVLTSRERSSVVESILALDVSTANPSSPSGFEAVELGPLPPDEGASLLVARVLAARGSDDHEVDLASAEAVVEAVGGIPLAIELMAARAEVLGIEELRSRVTRDGTKGEADEIDDELLPRGLRDALAGAIEQLEPEDARALGVCAVFLDAFTIGAAEALLGPEAEGRLTRLRDRALITPEPSGSREARFRILAPIRGYALRTRSAEERTDARQRLAAYLVRLTSPLVRAMGRSGSLEAQHLLAREALEVEGALEHALSRPTLDFETAVAFLRALEAPLVAKGATDRLVTLVERVRAHEPVEPCIELHRLRARALNARGRGAEARVVLEQVIDSIRRRGRGPVGGLILELGVLTHAARDLARARALYEEAAELLAAEDESATRRVPSGTLVHSFTMPANPSRRWTATAKRSACCALSGTSGSTGFSLATSRSSNRSRATELRHGATSSRRSLSSRRTVTRACSG
jgi:hypothetical protein